MVDLRFVLVAMTALRLVLVGLVRYGLINGRIGNAPGGDHLPHGAVVR